MSTFINLPPVNLNRVVIDPTPPTTGQSLVASTGLSASWQTPGGSLVYQTTRVSFGTIGSALISLPITVTWATPFADNSYTLTCQAVIGEASSDGAVTSIINVASVELLAGGAGFIATIANADSIPHTCTLHAIAIHD